MSAPAIHCFRSKLRAWRNALGVKKRSQILARVEGQGPLRNHEGHGTVHLIGTGPGDPKLLTLGAVELMQNADIVLYDRLVSDSILEYVNPAAEKVCVGKGRGIGTGSQGSIQEQIAHYARKGKHVVRLKGGDPSVFGRVGSEISFLQQHEISVTVTPGITTASAVAARLGFPLTHGGIADGVCLITGHLGATWITRELVDRLTLVVYMGLQELPNLLKRLNTDGRANPIPSVAVQSGTTQQQRVVYGNTLNLAERVKEEGLESPTIIIIGGTVEMASDWCNVR